MNSKYKCTKNGGGVAKLCNGEYSVDASTLTNVDKHCDKPIPHKALIIVITNCVYLLFHFKVAAVKKVCFVA